MTKVNLYTMTNCFACKELKELLTNHNIPFKELSSDNDLQFLLDNGITKVPVIELDNQFYVGKDAKIKAEEIINDCQERW